MKAMIFAAGIGSRLKPFTLHHPKALVEVGGIPMLQRVITKLKEAGVGEMVVNVHHFAQQIVDFLEYNNNFGVNITISDESDKLLDTGGGLLKAAYLLSGKEPIIVHNADIYTDFDITEMVASHEKNDCEATLLVANRDSSRCLYFDNMMDMKGWGSKSTGETKPEGLNIENLTPMAFGGVHIVNDTILKELVRYKEEICTDVFSITNFYIDNCCRLKFHGFTPLQGYNWVDVGKPESLLKAQSLFNVD